MLKNDNVEEFVKFLLQRDILEFDPCTSYREKVHPINTPLVCVWMPSFVNTLSLDEPFHIMSAYHGAEAIWIFEIAWTSEATSLRARVVACTSCSFGNVSECLHLAIHNVSTLQFNPLGTKCVYHYHFKFWWKQSIKKSIGYINICSSVQDHRLKIYKS